LTIFVKFDKISEKIRSVNNLDKKQIEKLVNEKVDAALKANDTPKRFFITENGRGVVDGGDLYNAVLSEVLSIVKTSLVDIIAEVHANVSTEKAAEKTTKKTAEKSVEKAAEEPAAAKTAKK
jgi:hypothetical protein